MVADFDGTDDPKSPGGRVIMDTTAFCFAELLKKLNLPAGGNTIKLHREDRRTSHNCPGRLVKKDEFIAMVQGYMSGVSTLAAIPPVQCAV